MQHSIENLSNLGRGKHPGKQPVEKRGKRKGSSQEWNKTNGLDGNLGPILSLKYLKLRIRGRHHSWGSVSELCAAGSVIQPEPIIRYVLAAPHWPLHYPESKESSERNGNSGLVPAKEEEQADEMDIIKWEAQGLSQWSAVITRARPKDWARQENDF